MKLVEIDKRLYRKRLNIVIFVSIVTLTVLSVSFGAILIELFAVTLPTDDLNEKGSNFRFNFVGVILALLTSIAILQKFKSKPYLHEIYYVWKLKQIQNVIYRRLKKIKLAAEKEREPIDTNAFIVLKYYYASLKQVYLLDDNTLTLSNLSQNINNLETLMVSLDVKVSVDEFERKMLINYRK